MIPSYPGAQPSARGTANGPSQIDEFTNPSNYDTFEENPFETMQIQMQMQTQPQPKTGMVANKAEMVCEIQEFTYFF